MLPGTTHPALARFEVLQELRPEGGTETLLARTKSGTLSVIKVLVRGLIPPEIASALSREGSAAARLGHDAIVQTRALILEEDLAAIVEEFVPGVSLQRLARFASGRGVRVPDEAGWYVVERVLAALAYAHGSKDGQGSPAPILHRGVGPGCIVVGWDAATKIGDFGLARLRSLTAALAHRPDPPSLPIVAPEQARGDTGDERADVFCAGLVALRLATGRTPYARFKKSSAQRMIAMAEGDLTPLAKSRPDLPDAIKEAFARVLEPDPGRRTITAAELLDVVRASFDVAQGRAALGQLMTRWRDGLEKSVTPWERRGSMADAAPVVEGLHEGALMLALPDERPSGEARTTAAAGADDEPWKRKEETMPAEEAPLAETGPAVSVSRVGAVAHEALTMPPLPAVRVTAPSLPVYGGPVERLPLPRARKGFFRGGVAAATIFVVFVLLAVGTVFLFKWLSGPSG